jgi:hypothetical protein
LVDEAPAGAKAAQVVSHVLDGLSAELSEERAEEARRSAEKVRGRSGGSPTKVGDTLASTLANIGVNGGQR